MRERLKPNEKHKIAWNTLRSLPLWTASLFIWVLFISYSPFNRISNFLLFPRCRSLIVTPRWLFNSLDQAHASFSISNTIFKSKKKRRKKQTNKTMSRQPIIKFYPFNYTFMRSQRTHSPIVRNNIDDVKLLRHFIGPSLTFHAAKPIWDSSIKFSTFSSLFSLLFNYFCFFVIWFVCFWNDTQASITS